MDKAAINALLAADQSNRYREFGVAIYQDADGNYCYSLPVQGKQDTFAFATDPTAGKLAAIGHTHAEGDNEASTDDKAVANKLNKPSYVSYRGSVSKFVPGMKRSEQLRKAWDALAAKGD